MSTKQSDYPVVIDGKTYLLRFKYKALEIIEDFARSGVVGNHASVKTIFYAGLRKNHPNVTLEDCADILDDADDFEQAVKDILTPFRIATGQDDVKKKAEPEPTKEPEPSAV